MNKESSKNSVVLVGQTPPPYNGQTVVISILCKGLQEKVCLNHVRMGFSASEDEVSRFKYAKIFKLFFLIRRTRKILKENPGSILYYPPASPKLIAVIRDIIFLPCVRGLARYVIYHYHAYGMEEFLSSKPLLSCMARIAYGHADCAVVPTDSSKGIALFFNPKRVEVIPAGRNIPSRTIRSEKMGNSGTMNVLFVGIHTKGKGFFDLIETTHKLIELGLSIQVRCAGTWASMTEKLRIEQLIEKYDLGHVITLLGNCVGDELWQEYAHADVFFFPTQYALETQGMVVVEAMAFGVPVVASNWRGPCDVVLDGETGILCDQGSIDAYTFALTTLYNDIELRNKMGRAGRDRYQGCYTEEKFIQAWADLFNEVAVKA